MDKAELFEILKSKAINGEGVLSIEKTNSRKDRKTINYGFWVNDNDFCFKGHDYEWVLSVINCKPCNTIILN